MITELPELEQACTYCDGKGFHADGDSETGLADCNYCDGAGFVPTKIGAQILKLIRHNSRVKVTAELRVSDASAFSPR